MKIAVIGAGPAGLTAAYQLTKAGINVEVYEASGNVGGMAKSIELWEQTVDIGPHRFFSKDAKVNRLWLEVAGNDYTMINRLTRIYYKGQFFQYPLKPFEALKKLGPKEALLSIASYLMEKVKVNKKKPENFEEWAIQNFGKRLYRHFFKTYSEKLWGLSCDQLDKDFAVQRIKNLNLWEALKNAFSRKETQHKTLIDRFAYPLYGTGMIYQRMANFVREKGNKIYLETPIYGISADDSGKKVKGLTLKNGDNYHYDAVVSSMPITLLVRSLPNIPDEVNKAVGKLKFRNTILVYLKVDQPDLFPDNWLYIHSEDLKVGRITNFRNWSSALYGNEESTILALEYWCSFEDPFWRKPEKELIGLACEELRATGLVGNSRITDGYVYHIPRCYPVYEKGYRNSLDVVKNYLDQISGLQAIGRYGAFNYTNQDHSILMGILAANNLINSTNHDLWKINSETQYQEDSIIDENGVVLN